MTTIEEITNMRRLCTTHEQHPSQVDQAYAAIKGYGDQLINGLKLLLQQEDVDLKLLALQLLQEFYTVAERALPAGRALFSNNEDRLVRVTAINTLHVLGDRSSDLIPLLLPQLESDDDFLRLCAAANLRRICRSEDAFVALLREATREGSPMAEMAQEYLEETES